MHLFAIERITRRSRTIIRLVAEMGDTINILFLPHRASAADRYLIPFISGFSEYPATFRSFLTYHFAFYGFEKFFLNFPLNASINLIV